MFREEFKRIEQQSSRIPEHSRKTCFSSALSSSTQHKNRYPDILPFEHSRVVLQHQGIEGSDYINANFLFDRQYISCQAPLFSTLCDFWRMIWEQKCSVVVMLTRLLESGKTKASMYWPVYPNVSTRYGDIEVTYLVEDVHHFFTIRSFLLVRNGETRSIHQIHYTEWPDFGTPESTQGIRDVVAWTNYFQSISSLPKAPLVVHCSAGVGRSGTFIAIHKALELLGRNESCNVPSLVLQMRGDRWGMVQTDKQYEFIYQAIQDYQAQNQHHFFVSDEEDTDCEFSSCSSHSSCSSTPTTSIPSSPISSPSKRLYTNEPVNLRATSAALSFA